MTRLLEQAIETVSALPDDVQDDLERILLQFAGVEQPPYILTPEEEAEIDASLGEAERGEFATDEEVRAMWTKHGRWKSASHAGSSGRWPKFSTTLNPGVIRTG